MPMKLYNNDLSPYTGRVRIQIRAKGLENEIEIAPRPDADAYKALNPTGKVPSLDTGAGFVLPESETIAEYIEDCYPEPSLRGHTALSKAKVRLVARLVDLYVMGAMNILFAQSRAKPRDEALSAEGVAKLDEALTLIESYVGPRLYAVEDRLTLADCALVPALFFCTTMPRAFGKEPFLGHERLKAYYERITTDDAHCARVAQEMGVALQALLSQRAA